MPAPSLPDLLVPIGSVKPHPDNAREHADVVLRESLEAHGQYRPIVVQASTGYALAGNGILAAATELGWESVAVIHVDVDDEQARRILAVDNRAHDLGGYDDAALAALLEELPDLEGTGYSVDDLDDLMAALSEAGTAAAVAAGPLVGGEGDGAGEAPGTYETGGNVRSTDSLRDYAARYEEHGRRLVVLDYGREDYARVTAALGRLRDDYGVDSNSAAVARHLTEVYPDVEAVAE